MASEHDERSGECQVFTFKEGLLSAVAHDLKIAVERWSLTADAEAGTVSARFDLRSLNPVTAMKDGSEARGALGTRDLAKIKDTIQDTVLEVRKRGAEARFTSTRVAAAGEGYVVEGDLELAGRKRGVKADVKRVGGELVTEVRLHQPDFGIKPYSAMLGALKIKPDVVVRLAVPAATATSGGEA
ncbi:MAG: YceI family protein [Myxococcales bacterium]|nr:YceI family protein [Myxococcales bacterium]MCB9733368.1 YceI family protein [Deltaproteobacteria bacterium]